jgi:flagellar assembly protein FliH
MVATARYLFDLDFDADKRKQEEEPVEPMMTVFEHEAQMAALERRVREEAHASGHRQAMDEGADALAQETRRLTTVVEAMITRLDTEIGLREERAVRLAISAAKKLARRLMENQPVDEVEQLFRACLAPQFDASHLVVRMHADHVEPIREKLEALATQQGFEGRLVFLGEEDLAPGDARIEWVDGGLARSQKDLEAAIDSLVEGYMAARPKAAAQTGDPQRSAHAALTLDTPHDQDVFPSTADRSAAPDPLDLPDPLTASRHEGPAS